VVKTAVGTELADFNITSSEMDLFYTINFPRWSGKAITQDPTFTASSVLESIRKNKINGFGVIPLFIAGMGMVYILLVKSQKH
jgi:hypothetical protein